MFINNESCAEQEKEMCMVELTDNATQEFKNYFEGKDLSPIRIYGRPG